MSDTPKLQPNDAAAGGPFARADREHHSLRSRLCHCSILRPAPARDEQVVTDNAPAATITDAIESVTRRPIAARTRRNANARSEGAPFVL